MHYFLNTLKWSPKKQNTLSTLKNTLKKVEAQKILSKFDKKYYITVGMRR